MLKLTFVEMEVSKFGQFISVLSSVFPILLLLNISPSSSNYREVHLLDLKYQAKYDEINQKRAQVMCMIVLGP